MTKISNRRGFKNIRKALRNNSTPAEAVLWKQLKKRGVANLKFRRQHGFGNYILDFYCPEIKLAIELDGEPHAELAIRARDAKRDKYLSTLGIEILRIENRWVFERPDTIVKEIIKYKEKIQN